MDIRFTLLCLAYLGFICNLSTSTALNGIGNYNQSSCTTEAPDKTWDFLKLTQEWAPTKCLDLKSEICRQQRESLSIWVIHGLWPTRRHTEKPVCCNNKDKFKSNYVQSILPQLEKYWPDLLSKSRLSYDFWAHEWEKHGTCAKSQPNIGNELKYFSKTLELRQEYDVQSILAKSGIKPQTEGYKVSEIKRAFSMGSPRIDCFWSKSERKQYLLQIYFCLDKEFNIIDCSKVDGRDVGLDACHDNELIYYPQPQKHEKYHKVSSFQLL